MAVADSMFMFEIVVEQLKSLINCKEFCIKSQFADVFNIRLDEPTTHESYVPKRPKRSRRNTNARKRSIITKMQTGQSILFSNSVESLITSMKQYPMELSLWSKIIPDYKIGSTHIAWSSPYFEYLSKLHKKQDPVCVKGEYNVFDELTSRRMAVIKLNVKLSHIKDIENSQPPIPGKQEPVLYSGFNSKCNIKEIPGNTLKGTVNVKAVEKGKKRKVIEITRNIHKESKNAEFSAKADYKDDISESKMIDLNRTTRHRRFNSSIVSMARSDLNLKNNNLSVRKSKSCSTIVPENKILNYIFGGKPTGPFGNQVYCVGYFTVQNDFADSPKSVHSEKASEKTISRKSSPEKATSPSMSNRSDQSDQSPPREKYKFRICDTDCPAKKLQNLSGTLSVCSLDLPVEASHLITVKKCDRIDCDGKKSRPLRSPPDNALLLDLKSRVCCDYSEKVEEVVGEMTANLKFGDEPCYCACECKFGFVKKTTFCNICGGYEHVGDEYNKQPPFELPFPCPIFHKLVDKSKISTSGSDTKRDKKDIADAKKDKKEVIDLKKDKRDTADIKKDKKEMAEAKKEIDANETKKSKRKKDSRFKFNYGYQAPQIGHSRCALPCSGTLGAVPKHMGWLWNADNVPGVKFRPLWKPGATNKHVVRLLKIAKNPGQVMAKKKKKDTGKVKRPLKRPLLIVHKKEGEYTVTMETMKNYAKPRTFNQHPYEDKPLVTYTIGRTSEENLQRKKRKAHEQKLKELNQREFIQGAFKDMCHKICLKTYQQALGILPGAESPDCPCYPIDPGSDRIDPERSCSCSVDDLDNGSLTDEDEWIVEFTPPCAKFDPTYKCKKVVTADVSTQYSYLDYRVKLLDRYGNPVPRFFKGPDGKQVCSDLGGFWGPDNRWLEINTDGYVGPDERWAPNSFIGPNGELVDAEAGKFQSIDGQWLVVGVDGYVEMGKWKFYPKSKPPAPKKERSNKKKSAAKRAKNKTNDMKPSDATWSCLGSVSPKQLSKMGIIGHGQDKKLLIKKLRDMLAHGEDVKIPEPKIVPRSGKKNKDLQGTIQQHMLEERRKCKHATPSHKGIVAIDGHGNKIYFRLKDKKNRRPKDRLATLVDQGISLSSFHVPCFHSFISAELMKKQRYDRLVALAKAAGAGEGDGRKQSTHSSREHNTIGTQPDYVYVVKQGWRPGAISNRLLKKLNKARRQTHPVEKAKPTKKTKKRVIDKPTLIICKRRGEYRIEMQVSPADNEVNMDHCSPLIYRISREDNEERVEKQQRKRHRIIKKAVDKVWEDPYHPEACEKTCLKAYKQAIGLYDSNDESSLSEQEENESCSCCNGEDDDSSDASSLDLEWEIHFSPPIASQS
ncbi:hypothetical protein HF086_008362 [Spodoptera exigua]|uniref:DUF4776 domain-containing protein n=1 Tax=Spodoptera exigua TaxID=7107 RepID=A0A922M3Q8_SPOEX|nr:hypothetical protein HF086_008362 [Spodoptera exigua]